MELWKEKHDESEWPDCSIRQSEDTCHAWNKEERPSKEDIEKMCSDDFFGEHRYRYYRYVKTGDVKNNPSCSSGGNLEGDESFYTYEDLSHYSCPVEKEAGERNDPKHDSGTSVDVAGCNRQQADLSSKTKSEPVHCCCTKESENGNHGHACGNVEMEVETSTLNTEGTYKKEGNLLQGENACRLFHDQGTSRANRHKSKLQALLNNPRVELEFYV